MLKRRHGFKASFLWPFHLAPESWADGFHSYALIGWQNWSIVSGILQPCGTINSSVSAPSHSTHLRPFSCFTQYVFPQYLWMGCLQACGPCGSTCISCICMYYCSYTYINICSYMFIYVYTYTHICINTLKCSRIYMCTCASPTTNDADACCFTCICIWKSCWVCAPCACLWQRKNFQNKTAKWVPKHRSNSFMVTLVDQRDWLGQLGIGVEKHKPVSGPYATAFRWAPSNECEGRPRRSSGQRSWTRTCGPGRWVDLHSRASFSPHRQLRKKVSGAHISRLILTHSGGGGRGLEVSWCAWTDRSVPGHGPDIRPEISLLSLLVPAAPEFLRTHLWPYPSLDATPKHGKHKKIWEGDMLGGWGEPHQG